MSGNNCDHAWNADSAGQPGNCIDCGARIDTPASAVKGEAVAWWCQKPDGCGFPVSEHPGEWPNLTVRPLVFGDTQPHPSQQAGTEARARLLNDATEIRKWAADCADARTWGGPTMYPAHPIDEARASRMATDILAALTSEVEG